MSLKLIVKGGLDHTTQTRTDAIAPAAAGGFMCVRAYQRTACRNGVISVIVVISLGGKELCVTTLTRDDDIAPGSKRRRSQGEPP
jgi:hypothetical protein